jgi:hypothetical protein
MHTGKKYQVRREPRMEFRIEDAEGSGGGTKFFSNVGSYKSHTA